MEAKRNSCSDNVLSPFDCVSRITVIPYDPNKVIDPLSDDWMKDGHIIYDRESRNVLALGKNDE